MNITTYHANKNLNVDLVIFFSMQILDLNIPDYTAKRKKLLFSLKLYTTTRLQTLSFKASILNNTASVAPVKWTLDYLQTKTIHTEKNYNTLHKSDLCILLYKQRNRRETLRQCR